MIWINATIAEALQTGINLNELSTYFLSGDFDAFSMLARSIMVVEQIGASWFYQMFGSIFFFIPRSIWTTKPVGSGYTIGTLLGWNFKNVSMPLIGEAYLNWKVLGVILLAIALGIVVKKLDVNYFDFVKNETEKIYFIEMYYPFTLGFLFFIMRGDLLSSWAYYVGFMVPLLFLYVINRLA